MPQVKSIHWIPVLCLVSAVGLLTLGCATRKTGIERPARVSSREELRERVLELFQKGRYAAAVPLAEDLLKITKEKFGPNDPKVTKVLGLLAMIHFAQWHLEEAEPFAKRALLIREETLGEDDPEMATLLKILGVIYSMQGRLEEAEPLLERAVVLSEKAVGPEHPETAKHLGNLGALRSAQGKEPEAERIYTRALAIWEREGEPNPVYGVQVMTNLAKLYADKGKNVEAEHLYKKGLAIRERAFGKDHPQVADTLRGYATLLKQIGGGARGGLFGIAGRGHTSKESVDGPGARNCNKPADLPTFRNFYTIDPICPQQM